MSRKHFVAIAEAIRFMDISAEAREVVAREMASTLRAFNSNFDRERFIEAATKPLAGEGR